MSETGSMTGWGVGSSVRSTPTILSYETADFQVESQQALSAGISARIFLLFRSPVRLAVSEAGLGLPSLHPKIPFPAVGLRPAKAIGEFGISGAFRAKTDLSSRSFIAGSVRGLRTVGSIPPKHHEVARRQYLVANDLRPRPARDLVRGTLARSSCGPGARRIFGVSRSAARRLPSQKRSRQANDGP